MRKKPLDKVMVEVICNECGTGQCKPIDYFRNHATLTCDDCGNEISVANDLFQPSIVEFGRTMALLRGPYTH